MAFHDVRLPEEIEQGASGGPQFFTNISTLSSGEEQRNALWQSQRGIWQLAYGIQDSSAPDSNIQDVIDFYYARMGQLHGFRFKDWSDFTITGPQLIGTGDGSETDFQVVKKYTSGSSTFSRVITRIVTGTLSVYVNDVLQVSGYTENLGLIAFSSPVTNTHTVKVTCEFDVPVRFNQDALSITTYRDGVFSIESLEIIELKGN